MNIFQTLKSIYYTLKVKYKTKNYRVSPQGECLIKYLIDVYVNCDVEEKQDRFEENIDKLVERQYECARKTFPNFQLLSEEDKIKVVHFLAATTLLKTMLFTANKEIKEKWLSYIKDEARRKVFENIQIV